MTTPWESKPAEHVWVQHDLAPTIQEQLTDGDGNPVDLTGGTVRYVLRAIGSSAPKIDAAATIVTPLQGIVSYTLTGTDTDQYGTFTEQWRATLAAKPQTFPASDPHKVIIRKADHTSP